MHSFRPLSLLLVAFALLLSLPGYAQARPTQPPQGPPSSVLRYEPVEPIGSVTSAQSDASQSAAAPEKLEISLVAFGKQFDLVLEPNQLFSNDAENVWIGKHSQTVEAPTATFYQGAVKGEPGSWVRVTIRDGSLDGMIYTKDEIYFLEPGTRFFADSAPPYSTVMYRMSDTLSGWEPGSCALEDPRVASKMEGHAHSQNALGDYADLTQHLQQMASAGSLRQLSLGIVADYEYYQEHGANSATDMQNILNQIDGIYRAELGITLNVTKTVVYTTANDPFSSTTNYSTLLNEFSSYKGNASSPVYNTGLAHLFTNRDLDSSVIGVAWIGTLCNNYYGTGLSQDYTSDNKSLVLLTAHEIGHNFNAPHDNQSGSACATTPFGYIMNPFVSTSLNLQFSSCSKDQIAPEIAYASCLEPVSDGGPTCSFSIAPTGRSHTAGAGTGEVGITTGAGCNWTAQSNATWITLTSPASGTSSGAVGYAVAANTKTNARSGTLTIAGKTFTVTQAAPCSYTLSQYSRTHYARKSSGSVKVNTQLSCPWTAQSNVDWITIGTPSGNGTKPVSYVVSANSTRSQRTGTLTIAGRTYTVTQNR